MPIINPTLPSPGSPRGSEETDVRNALTTIVAAINGDLDTSNLDSAAGITAAQLASAVVQAAGLSDGSAVRRGKSIIATEEARTNVAYGLMTTPDRVQSVVLPTDGLIVVAYQAMWKCSSVGAGRAAIFLGANQLKAQYTANGLASSPVVQAAGHNTANLYMPLMSCPAGLVSQDTTFSVDATADVTTGQILGGISTGDGGFDMNVNDATELELESSSASGTPGFYVGGICHIFAAAGTYDVSVQFKSASGTVSAKNRKLWVWTLGF